MVADLGSWRGRKPDDAEWELLEACPCPACKAHGVEGLKAKLVYGFRNRATHNLWVLLEEKRLIEKYIANGKYETWYKQHLDNTIYLPLIEQTLSLNRPQKKQ
jgi:queuine/archaeosine tRNA-ribosyltransferase